MRRYWLIIFGILMILLGIYLEELFKFFGEFIKEIGIAMIISGGLIFSLETDHYRRYFSDISKEQSVSLLIDDIYIQNLSEEKKRKLKDKLDKELFFQNRISDEDRLWEFHNQEVSQLLNDYYYKEYNVSIDCSLTSTEISGVDVIKKNIIRKIVIENPTKETHSIKLPLNSNFEKIEGVENRDILKIQKIRYKIGKGNFKDITEESRKKLQCFEEHVPGYEKYCVAFTCDEDIELPSGSSVLLECEIEYLVPITDKQYVHRLQKPCKRYHAVIIFASMEGFHVDVCGFAFSEKNKIYVTRQSSNVAITFDDWVLPGDGCIFVVTKD